METKDKALLVGYASWQEGQEQIEYPFYHTLTFYLSHFREVDFPRYVFVPRAFRNDHYIQSEQLAEDISDLVGRRFVEFDGQDIPTLGITTIGRHRAESICKGAPESVYSQLRNGVAEALRIDKRNLYRRCYSRYVEELAPTKG